jgi:nitrogen fixation protein NifB
VRFEGRARSGEEAARLLWERQKKGIALAARKGLTLKINTILVPGVNEGEVEAIARECAALGAKYMNIIPLIPVAGTALFAAGGPSPESLAAARKAAEAYLPQLTHCKRCRADAVGLLGQDIALGEIKDGGARPCGSTPAIGQPRSRLVAVATREGFFVNQHLGEADRLYVFKVDSDGTYASQAIRELPPEGGGADRWNAVADIVSDCRELIVSGIGAPPRRALEMAGITVHVVEGLVSEALSAIGQGKNLAFLAKHSPSCGSSCSGGASRGCGCA